MIQISQIQKIIFTVTILCLGSIAAQAQSTSQKSNKIIMTKTNTINLSTSYATAELIEIGKKHLEQNSTMEWVPTIGRNTSYTLQKQEIVDADADITSLLNKAMEETRRIRMENSYLRLARK